MLYVRDSLAVRVYLFLSTNCLLHVDSVYSWRWTRRWEGYCIRDVLQTRPLSWSLWTHCSCKSKKRKISTPHPEGILGGGGWSEYVGCIRFVYLTSSQRKRFGEEKWEIRTIKADHWERKVTKTCVKISQQNKVWCIACKGGWRIFYLWCS